MKENKFITILSWVATVTALLMYVSYISQINGNLSGNKGDFIQPFCAGINCTLWVAYGILKKERDWALSIANFPGIVFGFTAAFTAL